MAARFAVERVVHAGRDAARLADRERELEATFIPALGLIGASLRHRGEELLGRAGELERYARDGSEMALPLLHPWANRLAGPAYAAGGQAVALDLDSPLLQLDPGGLPIHGVVGGRLAWSTVDVRADRGGAALAAELDFTTRELLAVFPFPHRLRTEVRLLDTGLELTTTLTPAGAAAVPVSFGYHPYLTLPGAGRGDWRVELPAMRRLVLDARSIPTGAQGPYPGLAGPLDRGYDDGFAALPEQPEFAVAGGGRRIAVTLLDGYPYAQVYAPPDQDFICFEPMTAPTNALVSGEGLRLVEPGDAFAAAFRVQVADLAA